MNQKVSSVTSNRLAMIWAIIESRKTFPTMIVITAASGADDTETIAHGLARAAHESGRRTALLGLCANRAGRSAPVPYASLSIPARDSQRETFDASAASWRTTFDVVVIDAAVLGADALGAHAARIADGVVIAVCDRRRVVAAARALALGTEDLQAAHAHVVARRFEPQLVTTRDTALH